MVLTEIPNRNFLNRFFEQPQLLIERRSFFFFKKVETVETYSFSGPNISTRVRTIFQNVGRDSRNISNFVESVKNNLNWGRTKSNIYFVASKIKIYQNFVEKIETYRNLAETIKN